MKIIDLSTVSNPWFEKIVHCAGSSYHSLQDSRVSYYECIDAVEYIDSYYSFRLKLQ